MHIGSYSHHTLLWWAFHMIFTYHASQEYFGSNWCWYYQLLDSRFHIENCPFNSTSILDIIQWAPPGTLWPITIRCYGMLFGWLNLRSSDSTTCLTTKRIIKKDIVQTVTWFCFPFFAVSCHKYTNHPSMIVIWNRTIMTLINMYLLQTDKFKSKVASQCLPALQKPGFTYGVHYCSSWNG